MSVSDDRVAEHHRVTLRLSWVGERFLPDGTRILPELLELVRGLLWEPLRGADGAPFMSALVERERGQLLHEIASLQDDRSRWAQQRFLDHLCAGEAYGLQPWDSPEAVAAVTLEDLERERRRLLEEASVSIVAVGPDGLDHLEPWAAECFGGRPAGEPLPQVELRAAGEFREVREELTMEQAQFHLGYRYQPPTDLAGRSAMALAAAVLGGGAHGRLFREVREERSLAYGIGAALRSMKGLMTVSAGIDGEAYAEVRDAVRAAVAALASDGPTAEELERARTNARDRLLALGDGPAATLGYLDRELLLGSGFTPAARAAALEEVDAAAVAAAAAPMADRHRLPARPRAHARRRLMEILDTVHDPVLDEEVVLARSAAGTQVAVARKPGFTTAAGHFGLRFGSTDVRFRPAGGAEVAVPGGSAHFLEHKLFEGREEKVFDRFGRLGARFNGGTSFRTTTYHFSTSSAFDACLEVLLDFVQHPLVTEERVEKEKGIIEQEVRMYEDHPGFRGIFLLHRALYAEHPVRHPPGGLVEEVRATTAADLQACFDAFYQPQNLRLALAGDFDPAAVLARVDELLDLPAGEGAERLYPAEPELPAAARLEEEFAVTRPHVWVGWRDRDGVGLGLPMLRRRVVTGLALEMLFDESATVHEDLYARGVVDDSFGAHYANDADYGYAVASGRSDDPDVFVDEVLAAARRAAAEGFAVDDLERVRRAAWGAMVSGVQTPGALASTLLNGLLEEVPPVRGAAAAAGGDRRRGRRACGRAVPRRSRGGRGAQAVDFMSAAPRRVFLLGPTASGKTAVGVAMARRLDAEILSLDSMLVYRGMDLGTAKPSAAERDGVPHHLIDVVGADEPFSVARYRDLALDTEAEVRARGKLPLYVGGTTMWFKALVHGLLEVPSAPAELRAALEAEADADPAVLRTELERVDPAAAARIHVNDRRRVIRALEVHRHTGRSLSAWQAEWDVRDAIGEPTVVLRWPRELLHVRIVERFQLMLAAGLLDEVRALAAAPGFGPTAAKAIGYRQLLDHLAGRCTLEEAVAAAVKATKVLVRRQTTWLRSFPDVRWLDVEGAEEASVLAARACSALGVDQHRRA